MYISSRYNEFVLAVCCTALQSAYMASCARVSELSASSIHALVTTAGLDDSTALQSACMPSLAAHIYVPLLSSLKPFMHATVAVKHIMHTRARACSFTIAVIDGPSSTVALLPVKQLKVLVHTFTWSSLFKERQWFSKSVLYHIVVLIQMALVDFFRCPIFLLLKAERKDKNGLMLLALQTTSWMRELKSNSIFAIDILQSRRSILLESISR